MKIFVSSVIDGMESLRDAATDAIEALGYNAVRAESFAALPESPRVACLQALRSCDAVVLILGEKYGSPQQSGKSATHEEYDSASGIPVFVFVNASANFDGLQKQFLAEVQDWQSGKYTAKFSSPSDLRKSITKAIHDWKLALATGSFDPGEAANRALALLPPRQRGYFTGKTTLAIAMASGPQQAILRPSQLEAAQLRQHLKQAVLFGSPALFTTEKGTQESLQHHTLVLRQDPALVSLDAQGSILMVLELTEGKGGIGALIQEEVEQKIASALQFGSELLDHVDSTRRLTHTVVAVNLYEIGFSTWRTRVEHAASPSSGTVNLYSSDDVSPVSLQPPQIARGLLKRDAAALAQDLTVLLRRAWIRG